MQPAQSYSVGGQRSSGQFTGKPTGSRPDYRGRWCVVSRPKESTLHLVLRLRGGAKKRKKKSYTTPKKNKHKRKKVKLAVLKYYKVDENGKIHRLRRECPADECGAGVFMASHFDRHYCGKCCLTYCFNKPEDK
ncbi:RS27A protein, partial [Polyodon spathula]|nr:RS27A protein [Polyodon spathula]